MAHILSDGINRESGGGLLEVLIAGAIMALSLSALFVVLMHYSHAEMVLSSQVSRQQSNQQALWAQQLSLTQASGSVTATVTVNGKSEPVTVSTISNTGTSYDAASTEYQPLP